MYIKHLKPIITLIPTLILLAAAGLEGWYYYKIDQIQPVKILSKTKYNDLAHDILWVSVGEKGDIDITPRSATQFILESLLFQETPKGSNITSMIARDILRKESLIGTLNHAVVSIWVSKQFSASQALDYLLNNSYFGNANYGLKEASQFNFAKNTGELTVSEVVTLITITQSPAWLAPYCQPDQLTIKANRLTNKLIEYNPDKYGELKFQLPEFVHYNAINCSN